mgnify:CR=1 FL=1
MSTIPVVEQTRRALPLVAGTIKFEVTSIVTDSGDLPFKNLFVVTITDPGDVKDDVLARVATPYDIRQADPTAPKYVKVVSTDLIRIAGDEFARIASIDELTGLPRDRTTAIRQNKTEYLTSVITLQYDTLTTADAAYKQVISRLSSLVTEWRQFYGAFVTSPTATITLPQAGASVEAERTAVYVTARDARIAADAARDAAQVAKDDCIRDCALDRAIFDFLIEDVTTLETARDVVIALTETGSTNVKDFVLGLGAFTADQRTYKILLEKRLALGAAYNARVVACDARCTALGLALATATATAAAAADTERAALASVYEVCPTFDPESV